MDHIISVICVTAGYVMTADCKQHSSRTLHQHETTQKLKIDTFSVATVLEI